MRSNNWSVNPSYFSNLINGTNTIEILFDEPYSYIGGGYIKIVYNITDLTQQSGEQYGENASMTHRLPGIDGIINLYSSIYIPGDLNSMQAFLHY